MAEPRGRAVAAAQELAAVVAEAAAAAGDDAMTLDSTQRTMTTIKIGALALALAVPMAASLSTGALAADAAPRARATS